MAPEQIRGEAVDARSDLFALGVVLLESISGYAPFRKTTWTASSAATLAQEVSPTGIDRLSPEVQTIVRRAISRDPSARYESALAFLASLRKLGVTETTSRLPQSIASWPRNDGRASPSVVLRTFAGLPLEEFDFAFGGRGCGFGHTPNLIV
jgi:serine/threonine protein kinase